MNWGWIAPVLLVSHEGEAEEEEGERDPGVMPSLLWPWLLRWPVCYGG
jgi:hypothetical protein